jgi:hypothetical protein
MGLAVAEAQYPAVPDCQFTKNKTIAKRSFSNAHIAIT